MRDSHNLEEAVENIMDDNDGGAVGIVGQGSPSLRDQSLEEKESPLSVDEFRSVLKRIDHLGLTWSAEIPPSMKAKEPKDRTGLRSKDLREIRDTYPSFPFELGAVIAYALGFGEAPPELVGDPQDVEEKVATVRELVLSSEFRSDFFFKYALKTPYFEEMDWEVVIKAFERGIEAIPRDPYALVSILLRETVFGSDESKTFTFAVDERRVRRLIELLSEIQIAFRKAEALGSLSDDEQQDLLEDDA